MPSLQTIIPTKRLTRGKAIRAKCLDCCCYQYKEVKLCPAKSCALWPYRIGHGEDDRNVPSSGDLVKSSTQDTTFSGGENADA